MNFEEAKKLKVGQVIYDNTQVNSDGTSQRWKVTGKVWVGKRDPSRIRVPLKRGLKEYGAMYRSDLDRFSLTEDGAMSHEFDGITPKCLHPLKTTNAKRCPLQNIMDNEDFNIPKDCFDGEGAPCEWLQR